MRWAILPMGFIVAICCSAVSQTDTLGRWFTRAPLPTARQEIPHAVLNGRIYVPGGLATGGTGSTLVEVFDPSTNSWSTIAPLPVPLHHLGFAAVNGRLYTIGGYVGNSFTPTDRVYEYLPDLNLWRQKSSMPAARGAHIAVAFDGKIYAIGGVESGIGVSSRNDEYDPVADTWRTLVPMPTAREHLAAAVIDSLIYVVGGRVGSSNRNTLEAYSPSSDTWYHRASMPTARGGLTAAALNGRLHVFGGEIPGVYPHNEEYNPASNTWRTMAPMPTPRHGIGAATVGDSIFIIGGAPVQGYGVTDVNEAFTLTPITSVDDQHERTSSGFLLHQNYPNPFNTATSIRFEVAGSAFVSMKVYNVLGHEVATLVSAIKHKGTHRVVWNAGNEPGGVYLCRFVANNTIDTKKMVFMK